MERLMITLEKDEICLMDPSLLVLVGGDYQENELVELYKKDNPEQVVSYYALYIKQGTYPE